MIIIGAGVTGLTAAYHLVGRGFRVTVVEASEQVGGLATSVMVDGRPVDKYYHFICREDDDLVDLIHELGISDKLHWHEAQTSFFVQGRMHAFDTVLDLLRFSPVPPIQRVRFGLHVLASQYRKDWRGLDKVPAKRWLIERIGKQAYLTIWDPLLRIKFGAFHDQISAAWIWHRIHRVARSRDSMFGLNSYGFLEQGCSTLIDALLRRLRASANFEIVTGRAARKIETDGSRVKGVQLDSKESFVVADAVISTVAIPNFLLIAPPMGKYSTRLSRMNYLNIVCMLLQLDRPLSRTFWLNVNDTRIPFNGIVEITNLNPRPEFGGCSFVYIPFYLHKTDPRWKSSDEDLFNEYTTAMRLIREDFDDRWILNWWVSKDVNAQAICSVSFVDAMPKHETPINGLYITDSSQYYPEDRTISASIRLGRHVAHLIGINHSGCK